MRGIRADIKKVLSWILTTALTAGFVSAAGGTAGAETMAPAGQGSVRTATASQAEKAREEPLNEDGFLQDGDVWNDREGSGDHATPSSATPSDAEREDYPVVYAYYEKSSPEHLKFRIFVDYRQPDDKVFYSFVTRKEREDALKNKDSETALRDALLQDGRSRVREYDMQEKPSVDIPAYLEDTGLGNVPGRLYFWVENETDDKLKDIYSENNKELSELIYDLILPRVVATFGDGSEAWSGSVEKGTKIYLRVGETYYKEYDYAIRYTLDGTYPDEKKDTGAFRRICLRGIRI